VTPAAFGAAKSLFVSGDGTTWAVGKKGLYAHAKGGAWKQVPLPGTPTSAWAKDDKIVWVVVDGTKLYAKGVPTSAPVTLDPKKVRDVLDHDKRWLATPFCKKLYVELQTLGPSGGDLPKSYAGLDDAIHGDAALHEGIEYVVEDVGTMRVGAKVPSIAVAEKLAKAYEAKNPKAHPTVLCHEPTVKGKLTVQ
jgi:hypothetical protein